MKLYDELASWGPLLRVEPGVHQVFVAVRPAGGPRPRRAGRTTKQRGRRQRQ